MREINSSRRKQSTWLFPAITVAGALVAAAIGGARTARADALITSFETGGFDQPGDPDNTVTPLQTVGVTDGSFSLKVSSTNTGYWTDPGHIAVANPADILNNSVLKFDVTTSTGVQFVPIFLTDGGGYYQSPSGFYIGPSASPQTVNFDYSSLGLPLTSTGILIRLQLSDGSPVSFYLDNVRATGAVVPPGDSGSWNKNGSGNWSEAANWDDNTAGQFPGGPGSVATFDTHGGSITTTSQIVVTLSQPVSPAQINFDKGDGGYKIAGTFPIALAANVNVNSGNHEIAAPLNVSAGSMFNIAANSSLIVDNLGGGGFNQVVKTGDGTLTTDKVQNVSVDVQGGVWNLKPGNAQGNGFIYGLTLENGSTFNLNGAQLRNNGLYTAGTPGNINLGTGGVLTTGEYSSYTYFGTIAGAGSVIVGGENPTPQVVGFAGSNSYSGTTTVTNGNTLQVGAANNLGDQSATNYVILNNGVLQASADFTSTRRVNIAAGGGTLDSSTFNMGVGVVDGAAVTKIGTGVVSVTRLDNLPSIAVNEGTLGVAPNGTASGVSKVGNLTIGSAASIDLTNNSLISTSASLSAVGAQVASAYAGGAWTGPGLGSSSAAAVALDILNSHKTAVGYAQASALGISVFGGQAVNPTDVLARYTLNGDANLDGHVNALDFNAVATHFGSSGPWSSGDFNFDGTVNTADFAVIGLNFNAAPAASPALGALVPEPASMAAALAAGLLLARRRR